MLRQLVTLAKLNPDKDLCGVTKNFTVYILLLDSYAGRQGSRDTGKYGDC